MGMIVIPDTTSAVGPFCETCKHFTLATLLGDVGGILLPRTLWGKCALATTDSCVMTNGGCEHHSPGRSTQISGTTPLGEIVPPEENGDVLFFLYRKDGKYYGRGLELPDRINSLEEAKLHGRRLGEQASLVLAYQADLATPGKPVKL